MQDRYSLASVPSAVFFARALRPHQIPCPHRDQLVRRSPQTLLAFFVLGRASLVLVMLPDVLVLEPAREQETQYRHRVSHHQHQQAGQLYRAPAEGSGEEV